MKLKSFAMIAMTGLLASAYIAPVMADTTTEQATPAMPTDGGQTDTQKMTTPDSGQTMQTPSDMTTPSDNSMATPNTTPTQNDAGAGAGTDTNIGNDNDSANSNSNNSDATPDTATGDDDY